MIEVVKKLDVDSISNYNFEIDLKIKDGKKIIEEYYWASPTLMEVLKLIWKLIKGWWKSE